MKKRKKMIVLISIAVVLLLVIVWFCIPYSPLKADFEKDVEVLQTENRLYIDGEVFTAADFEDFPIAIRKYIENNGYIGKSKMNSVRMEYHDVAFSQGKYSLQGTTQGRYLTGGVPPVRFSM